MLVGFICIWQQVLFGEGDTNVEYPDMSKVMCALGTNASMLLSHDGTYHPRAIDTQFIQANGCSDPCNQINIPSIFRQQNDLVLLDHQKALLYSATLPGTKYQIAEKWLTWEDKLFNIDYYTLPFIIVQGFVAALFGRRDPREIRDLIYIKLFMKRPLSQKPSLLRTQDILVRFIAALNYVLAVAVVILCPPLFVVSLISSELQFWNQQPDAEAPYAVGQWEPWVVTCQVLLAALIARYHEKVIHFIYITWRRVFSQHHSAGQQTYDEHSYMSVAESVQANPLAGKPDVRANEPRTISPLELNPKRKPRTLWHQLCERVYKGYKMYAHPLNQSDQGLFDEMRNFVHWCRDPQAVSRLVIRHPVRPRDTREQDNDERLPLGDGEEVFGKEGMDEI